MIRHLAMATDDSKTPAEFPHSTQLLDRRRLRFGEFDLTADGCELLRRDREGRLQPVKLQPQPARVLLYLAERSGSLVTRGELQRFLWGENHFVDHDQGLNYCIRTIRKALGDDASSPRFLETVPRRGYRFRSPVAVTERAQRLESLSEQDVRGAATRTVAQGTRGRDRRTAIILVAIGALSLALHWALSAGLLLPQRQPKLAVLPFEDLSAAQLGSTLSDTLTDELTSHLARSYADRLGVIARASAFAYAGRGLTAAQLGSELDVDYLLTGGLTISDDGARITVQLIRVRDETNLWAEIYDRPLGRTDWQEWVRAVSQEIASRLALPPGAGDPSAIQT